MVSKKESHKDDVSIKQMIRERAYRLWEKMGKPEGRDFDFWLQAEREILAQLKRKI